MKTLHLKGEIKDNDEINETIGLWLKMLENDTLIIQGTEFDNAAFNLNKGWNLIGYPSLNISLINETFNISEIGSVFMYNNSEENVSKWQGYNPDKLDRFNTLKYMKPGYGYWVKLK